jgi:hypothetical protein
LFQLGTLLIYTGFFFSRKLIDGKGTHQTSSHVPSRGPS